VAAQMTCQSGQDPIHMCVATASLIQLVEDDAIPQSYVPRIRVSDFRRELATLGYHPEFVKEFESVGPGKSIVVGLNLGDPVTLGADSCGVLVWLIADGSSVPTTPSVSGVCTRPASSEALRHSRFYHAH
jgi:hypothetical protein